MYIIIVLLPIGSTESIIQDNVMSIHWNGYKYYLSWITSMPKKGKHYKRLNILCDCQVDNKISYYNSSVHSSQFLIEVNHNTLCGHRTVLPKSGCRHQGQFCHNTKVRNRSNLNDQIYLSGGFNRAGESHHCSSEKAAAWIWNFPYRQVASRTLMAI